MDITNGLLFFHLDRMHRSPLIKCSLNRYPGKMSHFLKSPNLLSFMLSLLCVTNSKAANPTLFISINQSTTFKKAYIDR